MTSYEAHAQSTVMNTPTHDEIAHLAHELWRERGCPDGDADADWKEAEQILADPARRNMSMHVHAAVTVDEATHK